MTDEAPHDSPNVSAHPRRHRYGWGWLAPVAIAATFILVSCGGSGPEDAAPAATPAPATPTDAGEPAPTATGPPAAAPVSFSASVQPVITATCARCHTGEGPGTPHVRMDTAAEVAANAFAIAGNVDLGVMPPWPASDLSVAFQHDWRPTEEQISAIKAWQEAGAPLDVEPTLAMTPAAGPVGLVDADLDIVPAAGYDGEQGQSDEYRCLVYDPQLAEDSHIEAYEFVPDQTPVVHHAVGYLMDASARDRAAELDGSDGQPGWSCFGGSRLGVDEMFLAWAPGQTPTEFAEGSGMRIGAGDFVVIQVHYHFDEDAPADRSALRLRWADGDQVDEIVLADYFAPAEIPCSTDESGPLCDRDAAMARAVAAYGSEGVLADSIRGACGFSLDDFADMTDGIATGTCDLPVHGFGEIVSVLGHEHELGKTFRLTLNPDTPEELVLLDIPEWSFEWQFNYYPVDRIVLEPGDWVRVECSWDRSLRDPELEPAYVLWADGTDDEMCFSTILTRELAG